MNYDPRDHAIFDDAGLPPRKGGRRRGTLEGVTRETPNSELLKQFIESDKSSCHIDAKDVWQTRSLYQCLRRLIRNASLPIDIMYQEGERMVHLHKME